MEKILYVASEALPFASSGGLGDVIGSLPAAVKRDKPELDVRAVIPLYSAVASVYRDKMVKEKEFTVPLSWRKQYCAVYSYNKDGVIYYFIDNEYYFKRTSLYGDYEDGERFAYFCSAVMVMLRELDWFPDVLHANDWQSALAVIYLKTKYNLDADYKNIKTVFSIHNILYQGIYDFTILGDVFDIDSRNTEIVDFSDSINLMKGAIVCSDIVNTVSEKYVSEIMTPQYSNGLDPIIRLYSGKIFGILNGIDYNYYNPQTDTAIFRNYTWRSVSRKDENKTQLQKLLQLPVDADIPMLSVISRLTDQKGIDLIAEVIDEILSENIQLVILGCGDPRYEAFFKDLESRYPGKVKALLLYNKDLSKKIYAASDLFLMPSKTEPCGLSQMIASRYGAVPIVRETGGLYDSIKPYIQTDSGFSGNGFTFADYNAYDMLYVIREGLALYNDKEKWNALVKSVMKKDFSWNISALEYIKLYENPSK